MVIDGYLLLLLIMDRQISIYVRFLVINSQFMACVRWANGWNRLTVVVSPTQVFSWNENSIIYYCVHRETNEKLFFLLLLCICYFQWLTIPKLWISQNIRSSLCNLLSVREFSKRVLSVFLVKIIAASFDVYGSGRLGREINLYQGEEELSKGRRGEGVRQQNLHVFSHPLSVPSNFILNKALISLNIFCFSRKL